MYDLQGWLPSTFGNKQIIPPFETNNDALPGTKNKGLGTMRVNLITPLKESLMKFFIFFFFKPCTFYLMRYTLPERGW